MRLGPRNDTAAAEAAALDAQIAHTWRAAEAACYAPMPGYGSRTVAVIGGKGGGNKTTASAILIHYLSQLMPRLVVGVDWNPNIGTLSGRLVSHPNPHLERLVELGEKVEQIHHPVDLDAFLQAAPGRVHLVHNDQVGLEKVAAVEPRTLAAVLRRLGQMAKLTVLDCGNSLVDQYARAALDTADHLVIGLLASVDSMKGTQEALVELRGRGYGHAFANATAIVGVSHPNLDPGLVDAVAGWCRGNFGGGVIVVPYDPALGSGLIDWAALTPPATLACLQAVAAVAGTFAAPPRLPDPAAGAYAAEMRNWA